MLKDDSFCNPILAGDFPDPSVIRVGKNYYVATSTFQFFPGVTISHSDDLKDWNIIGHAFTENEHLDLKEVKDSAGVWAPDISFYDNQFWITTTVQTNEAALIVISHSEKPEGPYSKPDILIRSNRHSDPSIFNDDDARRYLVSSHGRVQELSQDGKQLIGEERVVWDGTGGRCPEGPHIFKRNDYYYFICAEGATEYGHCEVVARSKNIWGPYYPCPHNPVLGPAKPEDPIQKTGHGKPFQTVSGQWYFSFLGARPYGGKYSNLGRESFISKMIWDEDDWFSVETPQLKGIPKTKDDNLKENEFNNQQSLLGWQFDRNPSMGEYRLHINDGFVELSNLFYTRRQQHMNFTALVKLSCPLSFNHSKSGLTVYTDTCNYIRLSSSQTELELITAEGGKSGIESSKKYHKTYDTKVVWLKVIAKNDQSLQFHYSVDARGWFQIGPTLDSRFLSPEVIREKHRKCFTGVRVGIFSQGQKNHLTKFHYFQYQPK